MCGWRSGCKAVIGGLQSLLYSHNRLCPHYDAFSDPRIPRRNKPSLFLFSSQRPGAAAVASFASLVQKKIGFFFFRTLQFHHKDVITGLTVIEQAEEPRQTHTWTFLTAFPSSFDTIPAPSFSLPQSSFRLSKTFPCHGILKVVNMCMSNAMNMDVTSFFGAWPPACPHADSPLPDSPPRAQDTTSE